MNWDMSAFNISSISGIVLVTMFLLEVLKRALHQVAWFKCVPVFIYAILISAGLVVLANKVIKTSTGDPILEGEFWKLVWAAISSAASASGIYTWLKPENVEQSMKDGGSHIGGKLILITVGVTLMLSGVACTSCPEKALLRESLSANAKPVHDYTREVAEKLTIDPTTGKNRVNEIAPLTPAQKDNLLRNIDEFNATVVEDRQRDSTFH